MLPYRERLNLGFFLIPDNFLSVHPLRTLGMGRDIFTLRAYSHFFLTLRNEYGSSVSGLLELNVTISQIFSSFFLPVATPLARFSTAFHLVRPSILPFVTGVAMFFSASVLVSSLRTAGCNILGGILQPVFLFFLVGIILIWFSEIDNEEKEGFHTLEVQAGFRAAVVLFIVSELMLFLSFFWALFHFALNTSAHTAGLFIAKGVGALVWYRIPLLNTLLLLSSGLSLTAAHGFIPHVDRVIRERFWLSVLNQFEAFMEDTYSLGLGYSFADIPPQVLIENPTPQMIVKGIALLKPLHFKDPAHYDFLLDCVVRGFIFLFFQACEYTQAMFSISDSTYSGVFYSLTGLHGFHVLIGVLSLLFTFGYWTDFYPNLYRWANLFRKTEEEASYYSDRVTGCLDVWSWAVDRGETFLCPSIFSQNWWTHRVAFDAAAWYWHFVDVIWLFVLLVVYWWLGGHHGI